MYAYAYASPVSMKLSQDTIGRILLKKPQNMGQIPLNFESDLDHRFTPKNLDFAIYLLLHALVEG